MKYTNIETFEVVRRRVYEDRAEAIIYTTITTTIVDDITTKEIKKVKRTIYHNR